MADNSVIVPDTTSTTTLGNATTQVPPQGVRGHIVNGAHTAIDAVAGAAGQGDNARVAQAKDFVSKKPYAVAALAGVVGLALLNTLRGKR